MQNDPQNTQTNDDIVIAGLQNTANSSTSSTTSNQTTGSANSSTTSSTTPAPVDSTTSQTNTVNTNRRAFDLTEGTENSAGNIQPEKFAIPKMVMEKYSDLVDLIKTTESMDDQERQYWFQILPIMTPEQVEKFRNILATEKNQLAELDKEYENELNRLNEKHLIEWKEFETKEKSKSLREAEAKSKEQEQAEEAELLAKLSDI